MHCTSAYPYSSADHDIVIEHDQTLYGQDILNYVIDILNRADPICIFFHPRQAEVSSFHFNAVSSQTIEMDGILADKMAPPHPHNSI